jgi:tetratricopeptide (TPR) repeat protein
MHAWVAINRMVREGHSWSGYERNCCFLNTGDTRFADISAASGTDFPDDSRAAAIVDWDLDGRLDLWVTNRNGPRVRLLHNETADDNHYVAVKLEGRTANRDAIGARLELYVGDRPGRKLIQTVRAGDGFLAQSSRWVHFGLGNAARINRLVVRWPGGEAEEFTGLKPDTRYLLVQGSRTAQPWVHRAAAGARMPVSATKTDPPHSSEQARIVVVSRPHMPRLEYRDFAGKTRPVNQQVDGPVLINLWASWCGPCLTELADFARHAQQLRDAGLSILALNVDALGDSGQPGSASPQEFLEKLEFPFSAGLATAELAGTLDVVQRAVLHRQHPLPVPCSFLIDRHNDLVCIYKGAVAPDQLRADLDLLDTTRDKLRDAAVPFSGRWLTPPFVPDPESIARKFIGQDDRESAVKYLKHAVASYGGRPGVLADRAAGEDGHTLADLHCLLGQLLFEQEQRPAGIDAYHEAVRLDPGHPIAALNLGAVLLQQGKTEEAARIFLAALKTRRDDADLLANLGVARMRQGRTDEAIGYYRRVLQLTPDDGMIHANLGSVLEAQGKLSEAAAEYRTALRLDYNSPQVANNLAWLLVTHEAPTARGAAQAVELASRACQATQQKNPAFLETLAAAYAEAGRFQEAISTSKNAIRLARDAGHESLAGELETSLAFFEKGLTVREGRKK